MKPASTVKLSLVFFNRFYNYYCNAKCQLCNCYLNKYSFHFLSQGLLLTGYLVYMKLTNQPINPKQKTDQLNRHQREKEKQQMVSASQSNLSNLNSLTKTFYQQPEVK